MQTKLLHLMNRVLCFFLGHKNEFIEHRRARWEEGRFIAGTDHFKCIYCNKSRTVTYHYPDNKGR